MHPQLYTPQIIHPPLGSDFECPNNTPPLFRAEGAEEIFGIFYVNVTGNHRRRRRRKENFYKNNTPPPQIIHPPLGVHFERPNNTPGVYYLGGGVSNGTPLGKHHSNLRFLQILLVKKTSKIHTKMVNAPFSQLKKTYIA